MNKGKTEEYAVLIQYEGKGPWDIYSLQRSMELARKEAEMLQWECRTQFCNYPRIRKNRFIAACRDVGPWKINNRKANFGDDWRYHTIGSTTDKIIPGSEKKMREALQWLQERLVSSIYDGVIDCVEALKVVENALFSLPEQNEKEEKKEARSE